METKGQRGKAVRAGRWAAVALGALAMSFPILWTASTSFKLPEDVFARRLELWPDPWTWENYARAWRLVDFPRMMFNSVVVGVTVTLSQVVSGTLAGFAFGRLKFPGRDLLFAAYLGTMMLPNHVLLVPTYLVMRTLNLLDTYSALILPFMAHPFSAFFMRQFFLSLPRSLEDAGRIDGCGRLGVLFRILAPVSKPALAALSIIVFLFSWNDFMWPLIMTSSRSMRTIQVGLSYFQTEMGVDWPALMAGTMIAVIPVIAVFALVQRRLVEGIISSGGGMTL